MRKNRCKIPIEICQEVFPPVVVLLCQLYFVRRHHAVWGMEVRYYKNGGKVDMINLETGPYL